MLRLQQRHFRQGETATDHTASTTASAVKLVRGFFALDLAISRKAIIILSFSFQQRNAPVLKQCWRPLQPPRRVRVVARPPRNSAYPPTFLTLTLFFFSSFFLYSPSNGLYCLWTP